MTPLAYRLHGHPVCLACFNDDYLLDDDDTARGWPARGDVPGCIRQAKAGSPALLIQPNRLLQGRCVCD